MAFSEQEIQIIDFGRKSGKSREEIKDALTKFRTGQTPRVVEDSQPSFLADAGEDISSAVSGIGREFGKAGEDIVETATDSQLNPFEKALQIGSQAFRGGARAFGEGVIGVGKAVLPQKTEEAIGGAVTEFAEGIAKDEGVQKLLQNYNNLDPETKRNVNNALGFGEGLTEILTGGVASRIAKPVIGATAKVTGGLVEKASKLNLPKSSDILPKPKKGSVSSDVISDIVPTRTALRDNLIATSFRLAPVEDIARIESITGNNIGEFRFAFC